MSMTIELSFLVFLTNKYLKLMGQPIDKYVPGGVRFVVCFSNVEKCLFLSARRLFEVGRPISVLRVHSFRRLFPNVRISSENNDV